MHTSENGEDARRVRTCHRTGSAERMAHRQVFRRLVAMHAGRRTCCSSSLWCVEAMQLLHGICYRPSVTEFWPKWQAHGSGNAWATAEVASVALSEGCSGSTDAKRTMRATHSRFDLHVQVVREVHCRTACSFASSGPSCRPANKQVDKTNGEQPLRQSRYGVRHTDAAQ